MLAERKAYSGGLWTPVSLLSVPLCSQFGSVEELSVIRAEHFLRHAQRKPAVANWAIEGVVSLWSVLEVPSEVE